MASETKNHASTPTSKKCWGVFDSGLGGLTVLKSLALQFPNESFTYVGDTARVPYGGKSPATIRHYSLQILEELAGQDTKGLIVACNSASAQLPEGSFKDLPLLKVIEPGCEQALQTTKNKRVGIIGTRATIESRAYFNRLKEMEPEIEVFQQECPLFVPLVEEGWIDDPLTNLVVFRYLQPLASTGIDTLILGCTHYPILAPIIQKVMGPKVTLVESGIALGKKIRSKFPDLLTTETELKLQTETVTDIKIFLTDFSPRSENLARQFLYPVIPKSVQGHLL